MPHHTRHVQDSRERDTANRLAPLSMHHIHVAALLRMAHGTQRCAANPLICFKGMLAGCVQVQFAVNSYIIHLVHGHLTHDGRTYVAASVDTHMHLPLVTATLHFFLSLAC